RGLRVWTNASLICTPCCCADRDGSFCIRRLYGFRKIGSKPIDHVWSCNGTRPGFDGRSDTGQGAVRLEGELMISLPCRAAPSIPKEFADAAFLRHRLDGQPSQFLALGRERNRHESFRFREVFAEHLRIALCLAPMRRSNSLRDALRFGL